MADEPLHQPHDKLFKVAFSEPATAAAAFRAYLPERLLRHLDLSKVVLVPGTFIDEQFKTRESDLLYSIPQRDSPVFVYLLFEHQAQEDTGTALRLLTYMCRIWDRWRRDRPQARTLPVILPLVLAQQNKEWQQPPSFAPLFDLTPEQRADYASVIPDFTFQLLSLAQKPFERILGTPMGIMTLRVLKAHSLGAFASDFVWDETLLLKLTDHDFQIALRYIAGTGHLDKATYVTLADELRKEGREEGIEVGREQGIDIGIERGVLMGQIRLMQELSHRTEISAAGLAGQSLSELQKTYEELRRAMPT